MTNNGYIIMVETKGEHLTSNEDSREKAELGKIWQSNAGQKYRYYMVAEGSTEHNEDAVTLDAFLSIVSQL